MLIYPWTLNFIELDLYLFLTWNLLSYVWIFALLDLHEAFLAYSAFWSTREFPGILVLNLQREFPGISEIPPGIQRNV